ncbi:hypothetical protein [Streptomyces sp. 891-h]|uniref:hypothetical protein n=1 Tax=Streptomyces sp. 891-h TaxID=2720714 RepID=UPI001FAAAE8C|nr:hypothetical protein [Streptomyces sp. 891-h]UNZ16037.1 hypothetical protein HC362_01935 [Streptomyces sp. 891-h]
MPATGWRPRRARRFHAAAATLAAALTLLLTLFALGGAELSAEDAGCVNGRASLTAAATLPCPQVSVDEPEHGRHPGHDPSSAQAFLVATATHRPHCHSSLPVIDSPAVRGLLPAGAAPTGPAPRVTVDCHPRVAQRQILRC